MKRIMLMGALLLWCSASWAGATFEVGSFKTLRSANHYEGKGGIAIFGDVLNPPSCDSLHGDCGYFGKPLLVDPKVFFHVNDDGFVVIGDGFPQGPLPFKPAQGDLVVNHDLYVAGSIWSPALSELQTTVSEIKETNMKLLGMVKSLRSELNQLNSQVQVLKK